MLGAELRQAQERLAREQAARAEALKRRLEAERREAERVRREREEQEEAQRARRVAAAEAEEEAQQQRLALLERNKGVTWAQVLSAVPRDEHDAAARGVRRSADKVLLPPSVQADLMAQGAHLSGVPQSFELSRPDGAGRTHAGVLSFTAPEGTVCVPPHTARCLAPRPAGQTGGGGEEEEPSAQQQSTSSYSGPLHVRYVRLPKGTFCRLQPLRATFQRDVADIKLELESLLHTHSTLTVGDVLTLAVVSPTTGDTVHHALRVVELQPEDAVSVIDTDLEVVLDVSEEAEAAAAARARAEAAAAAAAAAAARQVAQALEARRAQQAASVAGAAARRDAASKRLEGDPRCAPPSGPASAALHLGLRLPGGAAQRIVRLWDDQAPLWALFSWVDTLPGVLDGAVDGARGDYRLVSAFPVRRVWSRPVDEDADVTLHQAGLLAGTQEVLNLEVVS